MSLNLKRTPRISEETVYRLCLMGIILTINSRHWLQTKNKLQKRNPKIEENNHKTVLYLRNNPQASWTTLNFYYSNLITKYLCISSSRLDPSPHFISAQISIRCNNKNRRNKRWLNQLHHRRLRMYLRARISAGRESNQPSQARALNRVEKMPLILAI